MMKKEYICPRILLSGLIVEDVLVGTSNTEFDETTGNDVKKNNYIDFSDEESIW